MAPRPSRSGTAPRSCCGGPERGAGGFSPGSFSAASGSEPASSSRSSTTSWSADSSSLLRFLDQPVGLVLASLGEFAERVLGQIPGLLVPVGAVRLPLFFARVLPRHPVSAPRRIGHEPASWLPVPLPSPAQPSREHQRRVVGQRGHFPQPPEPAPRPGRVGCGRRHGAGRPSRRAAAAAGSGAGGSRWSRRRPGPHGPAPAAAPRRRGRRRGCRCPSAPPGCALARRRDPAGAPTSPCSRPVRTCPGRRSACSAARGGWRRNAPPPPRAGAGRGSGCRPAAPPRRR